MSPEERVLQLRDRLDELERHIAASTPDQRPALEAEAVELELHLVALEIDLAGW